MPYLTLTKNLKLQLSPGIVASYNIQPGNRVGLFWDKHTHVYLLTYLPWTHTGHKDQISSQVCRSSIMVKRTVHFSKFVISYLFGWQSLNPIMHGTVKQLRSQQPRIAAMLDF